MPTTETLMEKILTHTARDPGLQANNTNTQIADGLDGGRMMNGAIGTAIDETGVNDDGIITERDLEIVSDHIRANPALYGAFVLGHGDDTGEEETGFHLVQGNDGSLKFQGRDFIDTVADAIYHIGFRYADGRLRNEDGNANEQVADVAGWLNYYVNGENRVFGTQKSETLHSGKYSAQLAAARDEIFTAGGGHDRIWADKGDDVIYAGWGNDQMGGGEGNDLIMAGTGDDKAYGDTGRDTIYGEDGDDMLGGDEGHDALYAGNGNDRAYGGSGHDLIRGGAGRDDLGGSDGDDTLYGEDGHDKLHGSEGRDRLFGGAADDTLYGGEMGDRLYGGGGADELHGNDGNDLIYSGNGRNITYGGDGKDKAYGGDKVDIMHGGDGGDLLSGGDHDDKLYGGEGYDTLRGGWGHDDISGGAGHDKLYGSNGADHLHGSDGNDVMYGGRGNDEISGGSGRDTFAGGKGADDMQAWEHRQERDVFVFADGDTGLKKADRDVISGFGTGTDKLDLTGYDNLRWVSDGDFNATGRGEVSYLGKLVMIDTDGNGQIDALIEVSADGELTRGDFIL